MIEALKLRRSVYRINKQLPVEENRIVQLVEEATRLVPDAFDMKSQRVVLVTGEQQDRLWDAIYDAFGGKVPREKIDGFKAGYGTVLYFYDNATVKSLQEKYALYAANFPVWAQQANGMLQLAIWSGLSELGVGANLQHYNPVIDEAVRKLTGVPEDYVLVAQMPFGGVVERPAPKAEEDISRRVTRV